MAFTRSGVRLPLAPPAFVRFASDDPMSRSFERLFAARFFCEAADNARHGIA